MRNVGIAAIILGIVLILLTMAGVLGQGGIRTSLVAAVVVILVGVFLYRRKPSQP